MLQRIAGFLAAHRVSDCAGRRGAAQRWRVHEHHPCIEFIQQKTPPDAVTQQRCHQDSQMK